MRLTCRNGGETFFLEGSGYISAAKVLDLENRRQLVWVDDACRIRVLTAITAIVREQKSTARSLAAIAGKAEKSGHVLGIPATSTKFKAPAEGLRRHGRVVWTESESSDLKPRRIAAKESSRSHRLRTLTIVSAACIAVVALGVRFPHQISHQLALSFTRQVTPYTALYFTEPKALPTRLPTHMTGQFGFTVFNHEGRERVYDYVVTMAGPDGSRVVGGGSIDLKDNQRISRVVRLSPTGRHMAYLITVTLERPYQQNIFFRGYS